MADRVGDKLEVEIIDHPLSDDYMNVVEIACAVSPKKNQS